MKPGHPRPSQTQAGMRAGPRLDGPADGDRRFQPWPAQIQHRDLSPKRPGSCSSRCGRRDRGGWCCGMINWVGSACRTVQSCTVHTVQTVQQNSTEKAKRNIATTLLRSRSRRPPPARSGKQSSACLAWPTRQSASKLAFPSGPDTSAGRALDCTDCTVL